MGLEPAVSGLRCEKAMAEIINLRRIKKAKARVEADAKAAQNRVDFGRTKAERKLTEAQRELGERRIDGHRRETPQTSGDNE